MLTPENLFCAKIQQYWREGAITHLTHCDEFIDAHRMCKRQCPATGCVQTIGLADVYVYALSWAVKDLFGRQSIPPFEYAEGITVVTQGIFSLGVSQ